jgi:hypothetical protein
MTTQFYIDHYIDPETFVSHTVNQNFYSWSMEWSGYGHNPAHNYAEHVHPDIYCNGLGSPSDIYWLTMTITGTKQNQWSDDPYASPSNYPQTFTNMVIDIDTSSYVGTYSITNSDPLIGGHFSVSPQTQTIVYRIYGANHIHAQPWLEWPPWYADRIGGDWYFKVEIISDGYVPPTIFTNASQMIIEQN